jgi:hypothetical protein
MEAHLIRLAVIQEFLRLEHWELLFDEGLTVVKYLKMFNGPKMYEKNLTVEKYLKLFEVNLNIFCNGFLLFMNFFLL